MIQKLLLFLLSIFLFSALQGQEKVKLYGKVTDFDGNPIDSVTVRLKGKIDSIPIGLKRKLFDNAYETLTDKNGNFTLIVEKGIYYCLYAIKLSDYRINKLEYWDWNVPIYNDLEINPQYDRMEIYSINVFEPQVGPFETYIIYFRPMSLTKDLKISDINIKKGDTINIAPNELTVEELDVKVNGVNAEVVVIDKVTEYTRGTYMLGYFIQVVKPKYNPELLKKSELMKGYDKITIILNSKETNEMGKGECFFKRIE